MHKEMALTSKQTTIATLHTIFATLTTMCSFAQTFRSAATTAPAWDTFATTTPATSSQTRLKMAASPRKYSPNEPLVHSITLYLSATCSPIPLNTGLSTKTSFRVAFLPHQSLLKVLSPPRVLRRNNVDGHRLPPTLTRASRDS